MSSYIVTFKEKASSEDIDKVKKTVEDQGGKVTQDYTIFKGFSFEYPEGQIHGLEAHDCVDYVEKDTEVTTQ